MAQETPEQEGSQSPKREERRAERRSEHTRRRRYRSFFWPLVFIGVGLVWLLVNLDVVPSQNVWILLRLWPVIFIIIGLDLLVGRRIPLLGALLGLGWVALAVAVVVLGPALGLTGDSPDGFGGFGVTFTDNITVEHKTFSAPFDGATSAEIDLDLSLQRTELSALSSGEDLVVAELDSIGHVRFDVSGDRERRVRLDETDIQIGPRFPQDLLWEIGLSPDVPTDLRVDVGSGPAELDLADLQLTALNIDGGSGPATISLPASEPYEIEMDIGSGPYTVDLADDAEITLDVSGGSGPYRMTIGEDAEVEMRVDAGSGPFEIDVPSDAAVQLTVDDSGSGPLDVPSGFDLVDDGNDDDRKTGTWETDGFDDADHQIRITVTDMGSGPINIR